ncbi:MAG: NADH-quinone oxidoreductase subunit N [Nitrospirota bacterium]
MTILPHAILFAGTVAALLAAAFTRKSFVVPSLAVLTLLGALWSFTVILEGGCAGLLAVDGVSIISIALILFASLCITVLAYPYFQMHDSLSDEFFLLLMMATLGGLVLASSSHFGTLFLGIELIGLPLIVMAAYRPGHPGGMEAGFKYLVLSGMSSAILLFGIALIYADTGTLRFGPASDALLDLTSGTPLRSMGTVLLIAGLGFKLALVPFHFWAPDVYEGAPAPVTVFAATISKAAVIAILIRLFPPPVIEQSRFLFALFAVLSLGSMTLGNLLAVRQRNVKRMLAYSSIAHNGYLLVAFLSGGTLAAMAVMLYLVSYVITNLAAFSVVSLRSRNDSDAQDLDDYAGLSWRRPWIAGIMTVAMLSLLGIPLTAGFIAKYSVVAAGMASTHLVLVLALVLNTAVSAYYYLRIVMTMFLSPDDVPAGSDPLAGKRLPVLGSLSATVAAALLILFGVMPQYLIDFVQKLLY